MNTRPEGRYFPQFDGIRAFAVLAVVLYHAEAVSPGAPVFGGGFLGVSVFFTLSGFLIGSQLLREHETRGAVALDGFLRRRIARLVPAALVTIALVVVVSRTGLAAWGVPAGFAPADVAAAVWNVTNWHLIALSDAQLFRLFHPLTHFWSLAVEAQLYTALALACWAIGRRPLRRLLWGAAAVAWATSAVIALAVHGSLRREEFGTDIRLAEFAAGVLLAAALPEVRRLVAGRRKVADVAGLLGIGGFAVLVRFAGREDHWLVTGGYAALAGLWCVWLIAALEGTATRRVLSLRPLVWLGTISYSLYLVHWPIVLMLKDDRLGTGRWAGIAVRVAVSLAAAFLLHLAVEQPLRRTVAARATRPVVIAWLIAALAVTAFGVVALRG
ncbi:MAG: acyltransferase family protein [Ilumatobacteraceae bacterium]